MGDVANLFIKNIIPTFINLLIDNFNKYMFKSLFIKLIRTIYQFMTLFLKIGTKLVSDIRVTSLPPTLSKSYAVGLPSPKKSQVIRSKFWPSPNRPKSYAVCLTPYQYMTYQLKSINFTTKIQYDGINFAKYGLHQYEITLFARFKLIYCRLIYAF